MNKLKKKYLKTLEEIILFYINKSTFELNRAFLTLKTDKKVALI